MSKFLAQIVAFLLIFCLVVDLAMAANFASEVRIAGIQSHLILDDFATQAFALTIMADPHEKPRIPIARGVEALYASLHRTIGGPNDEVVPAVVGVVKNDVKGKPMGYATASVVGENAKYWFILTNWHVINGGSSFSVFFPNEDSTKESQIQNSNYMNASVTAMDEDEDLAVLRFRKASVPSGYSLKKLILAVCNKANYVAENEPVVIWTLNYAQCKPDQMFAASRVQLPSVRTRTVVKHPVWPGSSGSPITNSNGYLVGLLKQGNIKNGTVRLASLPSIYQFLVAAGVPGVRVEGSQWRKLVNVGVVNWEALRIQFVDSISEESIPFSTDLISSPQNPSRPAAPKPERIFSKAVHRAA